MNEGDRMFNVLVITGLHIDESNPNAQCVKQLVEAMRSNKELNVTVVSGRPGERMTQHRWNENIGVTFKRILYWPSVDPAIIDERFAQAVAESKDTKFDCVVAVHKPYESLYAGYKYKKLFPEAKLVIYELDPIYNSIDAKMGLGKYLSFLTRRSEERMYSAADHIFHMHCNRKQFADSRHNAKASYLDFPLMINDGHAAEPAEPYNGRKVTMIYSGMFYRVARSPEYLLDILKAYGADHELEAKFYCRGDCRDMLDKARQENSSLFISDYIDKALLDCELMKADFLINISNKYSDMLPSKVLTYIATGKPVIHICNQKNDACIPYFEKYDNAVILYESESVETNLKKLCAFIDTHYKKRMSSEEVCAVFEMSTPEYSARAVYEYCKSNT